MSTTSRPPIRRARAMLVLLAAVLPLVLVLSAASPSAPAAGAPGSAGAFGWPLLPGPDEVVHGFHPPDDPWGAGHRGVDLAGTAGQAVHSAGPGVVTFAGLLAGRGVVTVTHAGGLRTTYEPVTPDVRVGDAVATGDAIGTLGLVGGHCLPQACLHWGLLQGESYLDPLSLVGAGPVRLLPNRSHPVAAPAMRTTPVAGPPASPPGAEPSTAALPAGARPRSVDGRAPTAKFLGVVGTAGLAAVATAAAVAGYRRRG